MVNNHDYMRQNILKYAVAYKLSSIFSDLKSLQYIVGVYECFSEFICFYTSKYYNFLILIKNRIISITCMM